jgi:hypothetical protein
MYEAYGSFDSEFQKYYEDGCGIITYCGIFAQSKKCGARETAVTNERL